jgi:MoaA/NifB/PqqE/SkfB family radical SAM enzyme
MTDTITRNKAGLLADMDRRSPSVGHLPFFYSIRLNEPCNQRCIMCVPNGSHGGSVLPFESFVELFDAVKPFAEHITLIGGEPLMHPQIEEILDLVAQHPIAVTINTNMTMLGDRLNQRLLALHELHLKCSIDAAERSTYLRIRGRDHFTRVTTRLRELAELARDRPNIHLIPIYVVMRENLHEVVPFVDLAASIAPHRIEFHPVRNVTTWVVENGTGWTFDGQDQSCESFRDEFNVTMHAAAARCAELGIDCEIYEL